MTGASFVRSFSGTFHVVRKVLTGVSSVRRERATSMRTPAAATLLLIDPAWNSVRGVARSPSSRSARPNAAAHAILPSRMTATLTAGAL